MGDFMINVVSFSGGRTSAYMAYLMNERRKAGDAVEFIFMDTGAEHPDTYRFIRDVVREFDIPLTCLRAEFNPVMGKGVRPRVVSIDEIGPDLTPWRDMAAKHGSAFFIGKWCTARMKVDVSERYLNAKYGKGGHITWIGVRADEPKRLTKVGANPQIRYLAEISDFEKQDILDWWAPKPFDLAIPEWLGNCVFCFKKSDLKLAAAAHDEPELLAQWEAMLAGAKHRPDQNRGLFDIYRQKRTIRQIIGLFDGSTGDEIKARIRSTKALDTGSCSESCEVYGD